MNNKEEVREFLISQAKEKWFGHKEFHFSWEAILGLCSICKDMRFHMRDQQLNNAVTIDNMGVISYIKFTNYLPNDYKCTKEVKLSKIFVEKIQILNLRKDEEIDYER